MEKKLLWSLIVEQHTIMELQVGEGKISKWSPHRRSSHSQPLCLDGLPTTPPPRHLSSLNELFKLPVTPHLLGFGQFSYYFFANRMSREYELGVEGFIQFGFRHAKGSSTIRCPCLKCGNRLPQDESTVRYHLYANGIDQSYKIWFWHGESFTSETSCNRQAYTNEETVDDDLFHVINMVQNVRDQFSKVPNTFDNMFDDAKKPLFPGCKRFTKLSALVRLYNLKVRFGWSNASFSELLATMRAPTIAACIEKIWQTSVGVLNVTFRGGRQVRTQMKRLRELQLNRWYFPIVPRFLRMFKNSEYAKHLCWHANERKVDGVLRHPVDTPSWRLVDHLWPDFGSEPRNLRLGLSTDGINPYGDLLTKYSSWPVIATLYNLQPWLSPLIYDLKLMWEEGVQCFDAHRNERFTLQAVLLWTINDFPAYGNLCGCSVKGYKACPICGEETSSIRLPYGKKNAYMGHRKYLPRHHPYRRQEKAFDGNQEHGTPPLPLSGETIYNKLKDKTFPCGKRSTRRLNEDISNEYWKRISAFYELAYWKKIHVRHFLDVMHIEKNVLMNIIGTLLDIPGKSKDGLSARLDLVEMNIRPELAPVSDGSRTYIPAACYTLSREEKVSICRTLSDLKVPEGYSSNFRSLVSLENLTLSGLKSHDCHVLMQQLLPIAIRGVLPNNVRIAITRLCSFFNAICSKTLRISDLDKLQQDVVETLCLLEKYFPPSFFTLMVHLCVHLVREEKLCGPTYLRWMYPFERYMKVLKSYVRNRNRSEGSIAEAHICEEAVEFCSEFLSGLDPIGLGSFKSREEGWIERPLSAGSSITPSQVVLKQAHLHILENIEEVHPYRERHMEILKSSNLRRARNEKWLQDEHNRSFPNWIRDEVMREIQEGQVVSTIIRWIAHGPHPVVMIYEGYKVNGICYNTKCRDDNRTVQSSGVMFVASTMEWTITYQTMTLGNQARLEAGCSSVPSTEGVINKGKGTHGPTGMSEITRMVSNKGPERRKNNKYNHRMSQKGYANLTEEMKASTSNGELIDRALVWKKAGTTKNGEIPDIDTKEVANKIDNLLVSKRASHSMDNVTCDILSRAIGGNDPPRRIRGVGQYVTPKLEAELMKHKRVPEVATKGETDESKIKSQMASKSIDTTDDANDHDAKEENRQVLEDLTIEDFTMEKQDKVGEENKYVCASIETLTKVKDGTSCRLAIGTKDNVVGVGTIFDYDMDGDNVKVSVDMVTDGNCFVHVPTREGRTMLSREVGSQLLWPCHLVIPLDEKVMCTTTNLGFNDAKYVS
ncbi:transposase [Cucumis melo var. makuwa]|uniref:Transposase n=1 Tax=Cucumis melo var. makuwa TaxID=1194695 RepID=A0A5A7TC29_CUCMM|nr:transposase [Cucumis melo var. makuwa]